MRVQVPGVVIFNTDDPAVVEALRAAGFERVVVPPPPPPPPPVVPVWTYGPVDFTATQVLGGDGNPTLGVQFQALIGGAPAL